QSLPRSGGVSRTHDQDYAHYRREDLGRPSGRDGTIIGSARAMNRKNQLPRVALCVAAMWVGTAANAHAQGGEGRGGPPPAAKAAAPIEMTGYWTAVITEDWHERMLTAPKGDFGSGEPGATAGFNGARNGQGANPSQGGNIPYKVDAAKLAMQWDPAKDEAEGNQCKAYGAGGVMRQPTHLHITWQD